MYSLRGGRQIRPAKMSVISAVRGQFPYERGRKTKFSSSSSFTLNQ